MYTKPVEIRANHTKIRYNNLILNLSFMRALAGKKDQKNTVRSKY